MSEKSTTSTIRADHAMEAAEAMIPEIPIKGMWASLTRLFWSPLANKHDHGYWERAKKMQMDGKAIPMKCEYENIAGYWDAKLRPRIVRVVAAELATVSVHDE